MFILMPHTQSHSKIQSWFSQSLTVAFLRVYLEPPTTLTLSPAPCMVKLLKSPVRLCTLSKDPPAMVLDQQWCAKKMATGHLETLYVKVVILYHNTDHNIWCSYKAWWEGLGNCDHYTISIFTSYKQGCVHMYRWTEFESEWNLWFRSKMWWPRHSSRGLPDSNHLWGGCRGNLLMWHKSVSWL